MSKEAKYISDLVDIADNIGMSFDKTYEIFNYKTKQYVARDLKNKKHVELMKPYEQRDRAIEVMKNYLYGKNGR